MGRRGPKAEPTALKIAKGNPGKRKLSRDEPAALSASGEPAAPGWLKGEALAEWKRRVPQLAKLGLIGAVDQAILAAYCEAWALWRQAVAALKRNGKIVRPENAQPYVSPWVKMERDARADVVKLAREIGLTPSGRSGMKVAAPPVEKKGLAAFLDKHA